MIGLLEGTLSPLGQLTGTIERLSGGGGGEDVPYYEGEYEATPTRETQVFQTIGLRMAQDFVVNPIPRNYGLITWNGFELTVS
jgi:hypothetical protein